MIEFYSAAKTILSVAVGIAYDERLIDIDRPFIDYIPKNRIEALSDDQYKTLKGITIKRLLTMSVVDWPFRPEGDSWLDFSLACKITDPEFDTFCDKVIDALEDAKNNI